MCTLAAVGGDGWSLVATDLAAYVADEEGDVVDTIPNRSALTPTAQGWAAWTGDYWTGRKVCEALAGMDASDLEHNRRIFRAARAEALERPDVDPEQVELTKIGVATPEGAAVFDGDNSRIMDGQTWVSPPPLDEDFKRQVGQRLKAGICPDLERTCAAIVDFFLRTHGHSDGTSDEFAIGVSRADGSSRRFDFSIPKLKERANG